MTVAKVQETPWLHPFALVLVIALVIGVAFKPITITSTAFAEHEHDGKLSIRFATVNIRVNARQIRHDHGYR